MRGWLFALLLSFWACAVQAQEAGGDTSTIYTGTAGGAPVVVSLDGPDKGAVFGSYFYRKYRFDIVFNGEWKRGVLELKAFANGDTFKLKKTSTGLTGNLVTKKGKSVAVRLAPAKRNEMGASELYQHLRLEGLKLAPGKFETRNGKSIRWYSEPVTKMRLFRIESGYAPAAMAAMNATLEKRHWEHVSRYFDCTGWEGGTGIDSAGTNDPYLSDDYVSYVWGEEWSCAGTAHPDFGLDGQTFDARTGKQVALDDLLWFGPKEKRDEQSDAWYDYRSNIFAPGVVKLLTQLYPREMKPGEAEDGCDYSDPEVWNFVPWYLTKDGLYVGAYFYRAARNCDSPEWSIIPYSELPKQP